jgi:hypothetical protein
MLIPKFYHNTSANILEILPIILNLIAEEAIAEVSVSDILQRRFTGDFFGLLKQKNISVQYWTIVLMLNKYNHPGEYSGAPTFKTIDGTAVDQVMAAATVRRRIQFT